MVSANFFQIQMFHAFANENVHQPRGVGTAGMNFIHMSKSELVHGVLDKVVLEWFHKFHDNFSTFSLDVIVIVDISWFNLDMV